MPGNDELFNFHLDRQEVAILLDALKSARLRDATETFEEDVELIRERRLYAELNEQLTARLERLVAYKPAPKTSRAATETLDSL